MEKLLKFGSMLIASKTTLIRDTWFSYNTPRFTLGVFLCTKMSILARRLPTILI